MSLSADDVRRIARLSRLQLAPDQIEASRAELNAVFDLIGRLRSVDTSGVEPMTHPQDMALRLRDDVVTEPDWRQQCQSQAPAVEGGLFLVPRVIE